MTSVPWEEDSFDEKILASLAMQRECMRLATVEVQDNKEVKEDCLPEVFIDFEDASREWLLRGVCVAVSSSTGMRCKKKISKKYESYCHSHGTIYEK